MKARLIRIAVFSVLGLVVAAAVVWWQGDSAPPAGHAVAGHEPTPIVASTAVGGPFELVDHTGRTVTDKDFRGRHLLVYFGFTYCPDICPTELALIASAVDRLGEAADEVVPVFITVDPERDTPEAVAGYVELFHPRMVGLTGTPEQVARAAEAYRVYYARAETEGATEYLMDHSSFTYLMGPDGENLAVFPYGTAPDRMAEVIRERLAAG